jgi:carbonic anhydrase
MEESTPTMKRLRNLTTLALALVSTLANAEPARPTVSPAAAALGQLIHDNDGFVHAHDARFFDRYRDDQHPRATLVACADSRFQTRDIEAEPEGDLFEVRNIGNQIDATPGSVEFGVRHLHTPLLIIVGHVTCGAVKAALTGYDTEGVEVRRELDGLHNSLRGLPEGKLEARWPVAVRMNVYTQVDYAMREYAVEIKSGTLNVVGAIYDFRDELGGGRGRLHIVDVNGERDPKKIAELPLMREAVAATKR